jgi:DNA-binding response OmpR family regulator
MSGEEQKCRAAGCDYYLTKPVDRDELLNTMSRLRPCPSTVSSAVSTFVVPDSNDLTSADLMSSIDLSDPEIRKIVELFVDRLDQDLDQINGAWQSRDWQALDRHAHLLKGKPLR